MAQLSRAGDGWINLIPHTNEEEKPTSLGFLTLFGGGSTGVAMCTWVPAVLEPSGRNRVRLGISHVSGLRAVSQLRSLGTPVPENWAVEQDHPLRGLVLQLPSEEANERVLEWALGAARALNSISSALEWRAEIYFPSGVGNDLSPDPVPDESD
ncbi:MAG: hypothetical protein WB770_04970 [Acidimicrobiales bacterium]